MGYWPHRHYHLPFWPSGGIDRAVKHPWNVAMFCFPLALFVLFTALCLIECSIYWTLRDQEGVLEDVQAGMYLIAFVLAVIAASKAYRADHRPAFWLLVLFAIGAFFVFGEELAWGQHLMGFKTPGFFQIHNQQGDTTLHNLQLIEDRHLHHKAFLLVGLYGSFAWLAGRDLKASDARRIAIPEWFLMPYFLPVALWYGGKQYLKMLGIYGTGNHQETAELFLALGILLLAVINLHKVRQMSC